MPIIGVTSCRALTDYLESVRRAGGEPHVLDAFTEPADKTLSTIDGLLLTGGADMDPALYGAEPHPSVEPAEPGRDAFELELVRQAVAANMPVLAVCRGAQVLNVAFGGTLVQDIPSLVPGAVDHYVTSPRFAIAHDVWISKDSRLGRLMELSEEEACSVNSRHHQAVDHPGEGLQVVATAPDGVNEAIERPGSGFCIGVQWHPENFWRTGEFRPLFEAFLEACRK